MKKYIALFVVTALLIAVLASCTAGDQSETKEPGITDVTSTAPITTKPSLQIGEDTAGKDYSEIRPAE